MTKQVSIEVMEALSLGDIGLWSYKISTNERTIKVGAGWTSAKFALDDARRCASANACEVMGETVGDAWVALVYGK